MARNLHANFIAQLTASSNRPFLFFEAEFASSTLYLSTLSNDISWNSKTWLGNGWLYGISELSESTEVSSGSMEVTLAGIPPAILSLVLSDAAQGKAGRIYFGFLDSAGAIVSNPYLAFEGKLDVPTISESPDGATAAITYESHLVDLDKPREYRYTQESQKINYPTDKGFEYVPSLQDWNGYWGSTKKEKPPKKKKK